MLTFPEKFILNMIAEKQQPQNIVLHVLEEHAKELIEKCKEDAKDISPTNILPDDFIDAIQLLSITTQQAYNICTNLKHALYKTKHPMKIEFVHRKAIEFNKQMCCREYDPHTLYMIPINIGSKYGTFAINEFMIMFVYTRNLNLNFNVTYMERSAYDDRTLDEILAQERFDKCEYKSEIEIFFKALAYIVCSGKPDLREFREPSQLNSDKKVRKARNYTKPILERIDVGLGYEKEPLYRIGEWERRGHFRNQPYGPKDNPTHYELIWINNTTVQRKAD